MATLIPSFKKDNPFESINDNELIGLTFNDQDGPSNNILWSSSKIVNLIPQGQFQAKQPNAVSGNFAKFGDENNSGQTIDSGILLDDNADPSSSVIWSSEKIAKIPLPPFQLKQPDAVSGNISIFGSDVNLGQVIDSGYSINDSLPPSSQVIWSSNQVQSQLLAVSQAKQPNANAGNLAIFGNGVNNGQAIDSGYSINDLSAPSSNVLYSSSKISQILPQPQVSFLSGVSPTSTVNPSSNILYVGVDGSSYVWNGSVYNNVFVKSYSKFSSQSPLSIPPGSNIPIPFPIVESSGQSSKGSISISPSGVVTISSSSQASSLYKAKFSGQGLNSGGASIQVSFNFVDQSNQQLGNSSSAFSFSVGGLAINSQCSLEQYFQVPPLGQLSFSVNIVTKSSDPPVILGNVGQIDNPYLIVEQVY